MGVEVRFADICDLDAVRAAVAEAKPGCILMETISNPLLRVAPHRSHRARSRARPARRWWWTTLSPRRCSARPLELGAHFSVHSVTKYLAGHGDVLGGVVVTDARALRKLARALAHHRPGAGAVRMLSDHARHQDVPAAHGAAVRQCLPRGAVAGGASARGAASTSRRPGTSRRRHYRRLFPPNLYGAMVSFEIRDAGREEVFRFMDALRMIVRATSLGDVHTMMLYPVMSSHREISPKHRERMGIRDNLVRLSVGIEAAEDIIADLAQALAATLPVR